MGNLVPESGKHGLGSVRLDYQDGFFASFIVDWNSPVKIRGARASFEGKQANFDFIGQTARFINNGMANPLGESIRFSQSYEGFQVNYSNNPLEEEIKDFLEVISGRKRSSKTESIWYTCTKTVETIRKEGIEFA